MLAGGLAVGRHTETAVRPRLRPRWLSKLLHCAEWCTHQLVWLRHGSQDTDFIFLEAKARTKASLILRRFASRDHSIDKATACDRLTIIKYRICLMCIDPRLSHCPQVDFYKSPKPATCGRRLVHSDDKNNSTTELQILHVTALYTHSTCEWHTF